MTYKVTKVTLCANSAYYTPQCECCEDSAKHTRYILAMSDSPYKALNGSPYSALQRASGEPFIWLSYSGAYRHLVKHFGITKMYYIQRLDHYTKQLETVDQLDCRVEARRCLVEYLKADHGADYYISNKPCKGWN